MFVVTFYSYKGGVGRTMALVNVAALMARAGRRVLLVDFDLEAPGVPSYGPLGSARGRPGLVDYVHEYLETQASPDARGYIVECPVGGGHSVWVLPAGDNGAPAYSDRLAAIDWGYLYEHQHGYRLLDDLRQQWAAHEAGFDYVLIDSRTGNTDIGGICTRQLPDAVVTMFVPTKQNVDGLVPIVDLIRKESAARDRAIELIFCPSNIPDLFDEDDILGKSLKSAAERLGYGSPAELEPPVTSIHHWTNMELLDQPLVVTERANSKLAKEYRELNSAIMAQNPADRDGALSALRRMADVYEAARAAEKGQVGITVIERTSEILRLHEDDGEIALLAAEIFSEAGEYEREERSLTSVIRAGVQPDRARLLRAVARINLNRKPDALEDLRVLLSSPGSSSFESRPAAQLLKAVVDDPVDEALSIFRQPGTRLRAKIFLAQVLMQDRTHHGLVADDLLAASRREEISPSLLAAVRNAVALALIGAGRFSEALHITREDNAAAGGDSEEIAALFNQAIATWGLSGSIPLDAFRTLDDRFGPSEDGDENLHQCIALVRSAVGRSEEAIAEVEKARERVTAGGHVFSCWTYTHRSRDEFLADLAEMSEIAGQGRVLKPPFLDDGPSR